ncbi:hypothetical protein JCM9279_005887 [Rhodotorula babjevae]
MPEPLALVPGDSLGPFRLGSALFNVLNHVRSFRSTYPAVKVAWDEQAPSTSPIHLTLSSPPLHLTFSALSQRLARLEVRGPDPAACVSYRGKRLRADDASSDDDVDVVKTVRRVLGPTYGSSSASASARSEGAHGGEEEVLSYPGVAFGVVRTASGSTMSRIVVTALPAPEGIPVDQAWLHPALPDSPAVAQGDLRVAEIHLDPSRHPTHVELHFHAPQSALAPVELHIGETTSEDILCELGAAVRTFWKEDDRLSIHTASLGPRSSSDTALEPNPYFLSYPHVGLTLLLSSAPTPSTSPSPSPSTSTSPSTAQHPHPLTIPPHTLLKVLLHSNLPGEVQFGRTARARGVLVAPGAGAGAGAGAVEKEGAVMGLEEGWDSVRGFLRGEAAGGRAAAAAGQGGTTRRAAEAELGVGVGVGDEPPMILDRTADGKDGVRGKTTEIHGLPGIALEVTGTGDIETVWLF